MERLPAEIWQQICSACDTRTAKTLRCCSKPFDDLAVPVIFGDIYVTTLDHSMTRMLKIAKHPRLQQLVKRVHFLNACLNDRFLDYDEWESSLDLREPWKFPAAKIWDSAIYGIWKKAPRFIIEGEEPEEDQGSKINTMIISEDRLQYHYDRFVSLYQGQNAVIESSVQERAFTIAFTNFAKLRELKIYGCGDLYSPPLASYEAFVGRITEYVPIMTYLWGETLMRAPFDHSEYYQEHFADQEYSLVARSTFCILKTLSTTSKDLRVLDLDIVPWSIWHESAFLSYWPRYHTHTQIVMANVKILKARFFVLQRDTSYSSRLTLIGRFLGSASSVKRVELDFVAADEFSKDDLDSSEIINWADKWVADVSDTFERVRWPKLRELWLNRCGLTARGFVNFMTAHRQLSSFSAKGLKLVPSRAGHDAPTARTDWRKVFELILPLVSFDIVDIKYLYDDVQKENNKIAASRSHQYYGPHEAHKQWLQHCQLVSRFLEKRGLETYPQWFDDRPGVCNSN